MHTLEVVAVLGLLAHNFDDGVDELGALDVVALGPVVSDVELAVDEVVGAEDAAEGTSRLQAVAARLQHEQADRTAKLQHRQAACRQ